MKDFRLLSPLYPSAKRGVYNVRLPFRFRWRHCQRRLPRGELIYCFFGTLHGLI